MMELPELPPADGFTSVRNEHQRFEGVRDFWLRTSILAYGELCWKEGYKLGRDDERNDSMGWASDLPMP